MSSITLSVLTFHAFATIAVLALFASEQLRQLLHTGPASPAVKAAETRTAAARRDAPTLAAAGVVTTATDEDQVAKAA